MHIFIPCHAIPYPSHTINHQGQHRQKEIVPFTHKNLFWFRPEQTNNLTRNRLISVQRGEWLKIAPSDLSVVYNRIPKCVTFGILKTMPKCRRGIRELIEMSWGRAPLMLASASHILFVCVSYSYLISFFSLFFFFGSLFLGGYWPPFISLNLKWQWESPKILFIIFFFSSFFFCVVFFVGWQIFSLSPVVFFGRLHHFSSVST